jgi:LmbE family N-acetylglucosaminyl deacetylase
MTRKVAIAIAAHPDDIEFCMAGTLLQFRGAGYETHYLTIASGSCGSTKADAKTTKSIRSAEARVAAGILGAKFHPSLTNDLEILYSLELLRALASVIREVKPGIVLTHSPQDYMEDHMITSRLAVTAAFARGMPNFKTPPSRAAADYDVTIYHAMPHGLCDGLRCRIIPEAFVDTASVHEIKRKALAAHKSQQDWLDESQGFNSFLQAMDDMSLAVGRLSKRFRHAEGWRRHLHLGFCRVETDPLREALGGNYILNKLYEKNLKRGI